MKKIIIRNLGIFCWFFLTLNAYAVDVDNWFTKENNDIKINVSMFMSSQCPHCHKANEFLMEMEKKNPWLNINRYVINESNEALKVFFEYLQHFMTNDFAVPQFFFCDSRWVGFVNDESTGSSLMEALNFCYENVKRQGKLSSNVVDTLREKSNLYNK